MSFAPARRVTLVFLTFLAIGTVPAAVAQTPRDARVMVTVVDPTGAVLPGAVVTIAGLEEATRANAATPVVATDRGLATIGPLRPGRYTITAEFSGFETGALPEVRLRAGDNKHVIVLELGGVHETIEVGRDAQSAASDPNGGSLATELTQDEIASLSDDPDELARQLSDIAGGNALIKIDSFVGGQVRPRRGAKPLRSWTCVCASQRRPGLKVRLLRSLMSSCR